MWMEDCTEERQGINFTISWLNPLSQKPLLSCFDRDRNVLQTVPGTKRGINTAPKQNQMALQP